MATWIFIPGLHTSLAELKKTDPESFEGEVYNPDVTAKGGRLLGYSRSELSDYFRTNFYELVEGRHLTEQDKDKILISDVLAKKNHLALGDTICGEQNKYLTELGDPSVIIYKKNFEIVRNLSCKRIPGYKRIYAGRRDSRELYVCRLQYDTRIAPEGCTTTGE